MQLDAIPVPVLPTLPGCAPEHAAIASAVAAYVYLLTRYSREDELTVDLTADARTALCGARDDSDTPDTRYRITADVANDPDLITLAYQLVAAARGAGRVPASSTDARRGVLIAGDSVGHAEDVVIVVARSAGGATVQLVYDAEQFDAEQMVRARDAGLALLTAAVHGPTVPLAQVSLVSAADVRQMEAWNSTEVPRQDGQTVQMLIAQQAERTPDAIAVESGATALTYREFSVRVASLAADLRRRGVGPDRVVGVCISRSTEMLVAIVAVLAAGGTFLPIDPDLPTERVAFKLAETECALVLTHAPLLERARRFAAGVQVLDVTAPAVDPTVTLMGIVAADCDANARTAYVMYTSGSTGTPKGVMIPHRALANHALWFGRFVGLTAVDRVLQIASISFDASLAEIFAPLAAGATIVVAPHDAHRDLLGLAPLAAALRVTVMQQVPSVLRCIVSAPGFASLSTLRYLVSGGEALDGPLAHAIREALPSVRLGNFYGPTEATVDSLAFEVPRAPVTTDVIPIGAPVANVRCRILDPTGRPVPIGMPGELHVSGLALAHGYLKNPERTAFRFIADPWAPGERLYRTGDLARYRADGTVECLGRIDTQIKLRGYRIEPAEIEAVLLRHEAVREAVVVLRDDVSGEPALVSYVVLHPGATTSTVALRALVRSQCPGWMVPSTICVLDAMPLMPSGKIDRRKLPEPVLPNGEQDSRSTRVGADALERSLQQIWESVLGVHPIGVDDDFFALGGQSVRAIRLLGEIERVLAVPLRVATLFEAPTVRALAERIRSRSGDAISTVVRAQPMGTRTPLFLAPGGGGELFIFEAFARALGADQPLYVLDMYVFDEIAMPAAPLTLADIAARMLVDIRAVQPHGPYQLAGYSLGGNIAMEIAQQLRLAGETVHLLALLDCDGPDYPIMQPIGQRILTHARHAFALSPRRAIEYAGRRARNALRKVLPSTHPSLYRDQPEIELVPAHVRDALERSLRPVLDAWERYRPQPYDGRALIVRADVRQEMIGVIDDDPHLGWTSILTGELLLERMPCDHFAMFQAANAPQLVATLRRHLREGPGSVIAPADGESAV